MAHSGVVQGSQLLLRGSRLQEKAIKSPVNIKIGRGKGWESLGITTLNFLYWFQVSTHSYRRKWGMEKLHYGRATKSNPVSASNFFPLCCSFYGHPWVRQMPSSCPRFTDKETETWGS